MALRLIHTLFWRSISDVCSTLEEYIICIQYFGRVYLMHELFWRRISYAYSILEYNILCIHYFGRVYLMHTVFWKIVCYAYSILEEYNFYTVLPTLSSVSFV